MVVQIKNSKITFLINLNKLTKLGVDYTVTYFSRILFVQYLCVQKKVEKNQLKTAEFLND